MAGALIGLTALSAYAQEAQTVATPPVLSEQTEQIIYKGVVGNILETVPMDAEHRVQLQKGNAVVSNAMGARSIALLLGIANPLFLVAGLAWGVWAASRIKPAAAPAADVAAIQEDKAGMPIQVAAGIPVQEDKAEILVQGAVQVRVQEAKTEIPVEPAVEGN